MKSPFPIVVCWPTRPVCRFTSVACSGAPDVRNHTSAECNLPAGVCNGTNRTDGLVCVVCSVTQALGRFSYGCCGPANIVGGSVWPRFSRHFLSRRPYVVVLLARPPVEDVRYRGVWPAVHVGSPIHISQGGTLCLGSPEPSQRSMSALWSMCESAAACSGDMYAGVPSATPSVVNC